jgi:hypothetical protein
VLLGTPNEDKYSGTSISTVDGLERKSRIGGDESALYVVPDNATADILSLL